MSDPLHNIIRRVQNVVRAVRSTVAPNDSGSVQTVQVMHSSAQAVDTLKTVLFYGLSSVPPVGTDYIALHVAGDTSNGVAIGSNHQASRPRGLKPGQVVIYDLTGSQVLLDGQGGIVLAPSDGTVTIDGKLVVTQDATIGGITFLAHEHNNGNSGGPTGAPIAGT